MTFLKNIEDKPSFDAIIASGKSTLLYFYAQWHDAALHTNMIELLEALKQKHPAVEIYLIEAENVSDISESLEVAVVPTFIALQGKNVIGRVNGANPAELSKLATALSNTPLPKPPTAPTASATSEEIDTERLKRLVNAAPVMLFMKGSPSAPRCGFSRQIVDILQTNQIPFASFDILTDESVRAGLKVYSDWPTYPQLYVSGELVGGLDIVKEMLATGDLRAQLGIDKLQLPPPVQSLEQRLKALIETDKVMLFMKGSPSEPRCGFSKQIVAILNEEGIQFSSFDILADEEVRAGLKTYSDWPTYPQLYANGVLIGGLDIVKEMREGGSLKPQLGI